MTSWAWPSAFGWKCHRGVNVHNAIAVIGVRKALLIGELCHNFCVFRKFDFRHLIE